MQQKKEIYGWVLAVNEGSKPVQGLVGDARDTFLEGFPGRMKSPPTWEDDSIGLLYEEGNFFEYRF